VSSNRHLPDYIVAPLSLAKLEPQAGTWVTKDGETKFPAIDEIPWLTPDPYRSLASWQNQTEALIAQYTELIANLKGEIDEVTGPTDELTIQRLKHVRTLTIKHLEYLRELLSPLKAKSKLSAQQAKSFGYRLPVNQGLLSYFQNLIRDWALETGENQKQLEVLMSVISADAKLGRTAVLGAGGCRLAFDLHESGRTEELIAVDINPVLFLTARRILAGSRVTLTEFPVAPLNLESSAVARTCVAPKTPRAGFHLLFADVYHLPFASASLDTVVTPWLIDILPQPLEVLIREIRRVLKPGGQWLNTGSLNFQFRLKRQNYSYEETLALINSSGFSIETHRQDPIPYLRSEKSGHGRTEVVTSFCARRQQMNEQEFETQGAVDSRPVWLRETGQAVPPNEIFQASRLVLEVQSFVLSQIDGKASIETIANSVSAKYGLHIDAAREAVSNFFSQNYEDSIFQIR